MYGSSRRRGLKWVEIVVRGKQYKSNSTATTTKQKRLMRAQNTQKKNNSNIDIKMTFSFCCGVLFCGHSFSLRTLVAVLCFAARTIFSMRIDKIQQANYSSTLKVCICRFNFRSSKSNKIRAHTVKCSFS